LSKRHIITCAIAVSTFLISGLAAAASKVVQFNKLDPRELTAVTLEVNYKIDGEPHYDFEVLGDWDRSYELEIRQTAGTFSDGQYIGDFLHITSSNASCTGNCPIKVTQTEPRAITEVTVHIWFMAWGGVHYDYEDVAVPGAPPFASGSSNYLQTLNVDATSGSTSFDGEKWVGNILSTPPQISSFYWNLNSQLQIRALEKDIWGAGFTPNTNTKLWYDRPGFASQLLLQSTSDSRGIVHLLDGDTCFGPIMRVQDSGSQHLRLVGADGKVATLDTNQLRPCQYSN
jgi:hypothetical protein